MIENEIFFSNIKNIIFDGNENLGNFVKIEDKHVNKAILFLDKNPSFENVCAICSLLGYSRSKLLSNKLFKIISQNFDNFINSLDSKIPVLEFNRYDYRIKFFQNLILDGCTVETFNKIFLYQETTIFKDKYGIKRILEFLMSIDFSKFDLWLKNTSREDLKYLLVDDLFYLGNFFKLDSLKYSNSQNFFIKMFYCLQLYHKFEGMLSEQFINSILESFFSDDEKLFVIIYFSIRFCSYDNKANQFQNILYKLQQRHLLNRISKKFLEAYKITPKSYILLYLVIQNIEGDDSKHQLSQWLCNKIFDLDFEKFNIETLKIADIFSKLILYLGKNYFDSVRQVYLNSLKFLRKPYSFFRDNKSWQKNFNQFVFFTIVQCNIHILLKEDFQYLIEEYYKMKKHYYIPYEEVFDKNIQQLLKT